MSIDPNEPTNYDAPQVFPPSATGYPTQTPVTYAPPPVAYGETPAQAAVSMDTPVKVLGICYLIVAALGIIGALFVGSVMASIMAQARVQNPDTPAMPAAFGTIMAVIIGLVVGLLPLITGIGLLRKASWGRVMAIVNGILILISIPVGTILGGITLYFMLRTGAKQGYDRLSQTNPTY